MTMQSDRQGADFLHSVGGQMIALAVVLAAVIAGAWFYVF